MVALVDKLQSVLATPLVPAATVINPPAGRTSLFSGDDAGIGLYGDGAEIVFEAQSTSRYVLEVMAFRTEFKSMDLRT